VLVILCMLEHKSEPSWTVHGHTESYNTSKHMKASDNMLETHVNSHCNVNNRLLSA